MSFRAVACATMFAVFAGCGPRQVEVRTAPTQQTGVSVQVKNDVAQAVNVYLTFNGVETFLGQVAAKENKTLAVQGYATGSAVGLKAVTLDGARTYSRANVVLTGTYVFPLP